MTRTASVHCGTRTQRWHNLERCIEERKLNRATQLFIVEHSVRTRTAAVYCGTQCAWRELQPCIEECSVHDEYCNGALLNTACMMRTATVHYVTQRARLELQLCIMEHSVHDQNCISALWNENSTLTRGTQRAWRKLNRALWNTACMTRTATVYCGTRTQRWHVEHNVHDENSTVHCWTQRAWRELQPCIVERELNRALWNTACMTRI